MSGNERVGYGITTDLLVEWTDPDTAMEAVGKNLGLLEEQSADTWKALAADPELQGTLSKILLRMVEDGSLEKRALGDGRYAFRWSTAPAAITPSATNDAAEDDDELLELSTPATQAALLAIPAFSCVLVLLVFLWLDQPVGIAFLALLAVIGLIGLFRRVPFAGAWMFGVTVAGLLVHFS